MITSKGRFPIFDASRIRTYDLETRPSKVRAEMLASPARLAEGLPVFASHELSEVAAAVHVARERGRPVILMTGAHLIKNGFGPLLRDLVERDLLTLVGMNMAGAIHDLELALIGRTSENVPHALPRGEFGFARQTLDLINGALTHGHAASVGAGEALGRLIAGEAFPDATEFARPDLSLIGGAWAKGVPLTLHASIGTDIIDQGPSFDPAAKGACSGRDFLIFCAEVEKMAESGGVFINVGTAVMGPEVFLKACSMCANVGRPPIGVVTASFDIRRAKLEDAADERAESYYLRDLKTVILRVPQSFGGRGYYIQGDHLLTIPGLYQALVRRDLDARPGRGD